MLLNIDSDVRILMGEVMTYLQFKKEVTPIWIEMLITAFQYPVWISEILVVTDFDDRYSHLNKDVDSSLC